MKKKSVLGVKKTFTILTISILICSTILTLSYVGIIKKSKASDEDIKWSLTLHIEDENNLKDYVVLGEAINASNGKDLYDMPKPPSPQQPYIRAWITTSLDIPYNTLWEEYKTYPSNQNIYNLTIFLSSENNTQRNVTISWDPTEITHSGYSSIGLYKNNILLSDMTTNENYQYTTSPNIPDLFTIKCSKESIDNDTHTATNGINYLPIIVLIIIIIVIIIALVLWRRKK